jgi:hypothetical protein
MNTRLSRGPLIPRVIAASLFAGGSLFALLVLPFAILLASDRDSWAGCAFFICGYLVYFGWFWRARHTPSALFVILLWLVSFAQNSYCWFFILREEHWHLPALHGFQTCGVPGFGFVVFGWWLLASILSIVALLFEFLPRRHDA